MASEATRMKGKAITPSEQGRINTLRRKVHHYNERTNLQLTLVVLNVSEKPVERDEYGEVRLGILTHEGYYHVGTIPSVEYLLRIEPTS